MFLARRIRRLATLFVRFTSFDSMKTVLITLPFTSRCISPRSSLWLALAALTLTLIGVPSARAELVGSGNVKTETRQVSGFHALELAAFGNVIVTQGDTEGLTVEGEDNLLPVIRTEVDGQGTLHLGLKTKESVRATKPLVFKLSVKTLDHLVISGSGNFSARTLAMKGGGDFDVLVSGSGNVSVEGLTAAGLKVSLQGSGSLTFKGSVDHQVVTLAGSGDIDAVELKTKSTDITLSGSGDCDVWATDKLKVEVTGSGDVTYSGAPTVNKQVTGSGSVEALGGKGR